MTDKEQTELHDEYIELMLAELLDDVATDISTLQTRDARLFKIEDRVNGVQTWDGQDVIIDWNNEAHDLAKANGFYCSGAPYRE